MPNKAVQFTIQHSGGFASDEMSDTEQIVIEAGFHLIQHSNDPAIWVQPFEDTEENRELMENCVEELRTEFPDSEVEYSLFKDNDPTAKTFKITIENTERDDSTPETAIDDSDLSPQRRKLGEQRDSNRSKEESENSSQSTATTDWTEVDWDNEPRKREHTDSDGSQDQPDTPSACLECGSEDIEPTKNKSDQFVCSDCKLVMYKRDHSHLPENRFSDRLGDFARADWSQQYDTAIVGLIKEPDRTYHEYYRIENPREFFEDCSNEQEQLRRIKDSGLEPFETLDLPQIDWRFSTH